MHSYLVPRRKRIFTLLCTLLLTQSCIFAADWVLGGMKFTFTQHDERTAAQTGVASLVPQLILEQIATNSSRTPTNSELLDRTLDDLLTKRLSLFLQLSKEVKTRDALVITEPDSAALKKKIAAEEEKIKDIQKQISENLELAEKEKADAAQSIKDEQEREARGSSDSTSTDKNESANKKNVFSSWLSGSEDGTEAGRPTQEAITLYKKDYTVLFTPTDSVLEAGIKSREFEKAVINEKINGLITGAITIYGDYISVTVELFLFPGIKSMGVITEVGTLSDCNQIAKNIARYISPKIANSMPINLLFDIKPEEAAANAHVTIDGIVYESIPETAVVQAGIHTVDIESDGFNSQTVTWNFSDKSYFLVHTLLSKKTDGKLTVSLKHPMFGTFYANGNETGDAGVGLVSTTISVDGHPVIGQFITRQRTVKKTTEEKIDADGKKTTVEKEEEGSYIGSFFYIPDTFAVPDAYLSINPNPVDNSKVIDERRIWMYRGYSALIVSLPLTFYAYGTFDAKYNSYLVGRNTDVEDIKAWQKISWCSIGVTCVAGGFFIYELVRYFMAVDSVIPQKAKAADKVDVEKAVQSSESMVESIDINKDENTAAGDQ